MSRRNLLLSVLAVLLVIAGFRMFAVRPVGSLREVPPELHGIWVTGHAAYSDRFLDLQAGAVTFGTGGVDSQRFEVAGFDRRRGADGEDVDTLYFRDSAGELYSREFFVRRDGGLTIVFSHQPEVVWYHR
jgi:hypothetical protein